MVRCVCNRDNCPLAAIEESTGMCTECPYNRINEFGQCEVCSRGEYPDLNSRECLRKRCSSFEVINEAGECEQCAIKTFPDLETGRICVDSDCNQFE